MAYGRVNVQAVGCQSGKNSLQMAEMLSSAVAENQNVIQIDEYERQRAEKTVRQSLESLTSISKAERHEKKFEQSKWGYDRRFGNVSFIHWNLIVPFF
jgi:hypothetical protein